ncbi:Tautomerase enzyme [Methylobacterium phyllostachyos]|uniref:Tautomerase enzyme n=2 Tax=Methylobacterium phyllostachyos TaxID=582672 RepID=A0A1H0C684_9HYPH|nr:Tautomerase enzyme [Methylobacterium phyllostachyos]
MSRSPSSVIATSCAVHRVHQHQPDELIDDADFRGIHRTDDIIVVGNRRDMPGKQALDRAIIDTVVGNPGARPEDVPIVPLPNARDAWSFGKGLASYAEDDAE